MPERLVAGFRLGIYVFDGAEVIDYTAPYGVFSVARRFDPELDVFLVAEALRPVSTQAGLVVLPSFGFRDSPAIDAFRPGGAGTRQMHNRNLPVHRDLPASCLLASVCTGSWIRAHGLARRRSATSRKAPDPIRRPISAWCRSTGSRRSPRRAARAARVDAGRIVTAAGISAGMELGFHPPPCGLR
jgi:putative intracellular protease/amidase